MRNRKAQRKARKRKSLRHAIRRAGTMPIHLGPEDMRDKCGLKTPTAYQALKNIAKAEQAQGAASKPHRQRKRIG